MNIIMQNAEVKEGVDPLKDLAGTIELSVNEVAAAVAMYVAAKHGLVIPAVDVSFEIGHDRDESSWLECAKAPVKVRIAQVL